MLLSVFGSRIRERLGGGTRVQEVRGGAEVLAPPKIGGERLRSSEGVLERPPEKIVAPNERVHPGVLESTRENRRDAWMRPFAAATVAPPEAMSMG